MLIFLDYRISERHKFSTWFVFYDMSFNSDKISAILQWTIYPWRKPKIKTIRSPLMKEYEERLTKKTNEKHNKGFRS